jgi:hypothetical protein
MPFYHFDIHKGRARAEGLGSIDLTDNAEALAFGKRVIEDLNSGDRERYAGWTMDITHDNDLTVAILFDAVGPKK